MAEPDIDTLTVNNLTVFLDTKLNKNVHIDGFVNIAHGSVFLQSAPFALEGGIESYPWGKTNVHGTLGVGESLEVQGSIYAAQGIETAQNLTVGRNLYVDQSVLIGGNLRANGASFANSTVEIGDNRVDINAAISHQGSLLQTGSSKTIGSSIHDGSHLNRGTFTSQGVTVLSGTTDVVDVFTADQLTVREEVTIHGNLQLDQKLTASGGAQFTGGVEVRGDAIFNPSDGQSGSGTVSLNVPLVSTSGISQIYGDVSLLGDQVHVSDFAVQEGGRIRQQGNAPNSLGGHTSFKDRVRVRRDLAVDGHTHLNRRLTMRDGQAVQTARTSQLGGVICDDLKVSQGHNFQVAQGDSYLRGSLYVGGDVTLNGDMYKSYFNTYAILGEDGNPGGSWEANVDAVTWRGVTFNAYYTDFTFAGNDAIAEMNMNMDPNMNTDSEFFNANLWQVSVDRAHWTPGYSEVSEFDVFYFQKGMEPNSNVSSISTWVEVRGDLNVPGPLATDPGVYRVDGHQVLREPLFAYYSVLPPTQITNPYNIPPLKHPDWGWALAAHIGIETIYIELIRHGLIFGILGPHTQMFPPPP